MNNGYKLYYYSIKLSRVPSFFFPERVYFAVTINFRIIIEKQTNPKHNP